MNTLAVNPPPFRHLFEIPDRPRRRQIRRDIPGRAMNSFNTLPPSGQGQITGARMSAGSSWGGITTSNGDDSLNRQYLIDLGMTQSRAQDLDINNPDIHGFNRARTAQIMGKGVIFKHSPRADEVKMSEAKLLEITQKVDRVRQIHSRLGGFDAQGLGRSEGKQQERAMLTALVLGCCLIHRVWRNDRRYPIPLSIELIPGSRISTPYERMGDPLISFGVEYTDEHRTRVVGWHIRNVSKTVGNSFITDPTWTFIPVEDGSLLSLTEIAGIDRALPLSTCCIRSIRNYNEFIESAVASARAQSRYHMVNYAAPNENAYDKAEDDASFVEQGYPQGFVNLGDDTQALYEQAGAKVEWAQTKLPDPDFENFTKEIKHRMGRGQVASISRFTREVNNSWAGGRLEDQQDDPIIDQYRDAFLQAWHRVNEWFVEAVWLASAVELPGYSDSTSAVWAEFHARFFGKVHINPVDTATAREKLFGLRSSCPQMACEEDGTDARFVLEQWAIYFKMQRDFETKYGLPHGSLDVLLSGKAMTTSAGEVIQPKPQDEPDPENADANPRISGLSNRNDAAMNYMGRMAHV